MTRADSFWNDVDIKGEDDCWEYLGNIRSDGRGQLWFQERMQKAHRVAFFLTYGYWPLNALHSCDNPPCCNPKHLREGTHKDNAEDRAERGRAATHNLDGKGPRGEDHHFAKLTLENVAEIRSTPIKHGTKAELARRYGVSHKLIRCVLSGSIWKDE